MNRTCLKWVGCLATALALTACSRDGMADRDRLPEETYPITFTALGLEAAPVTRATADGIWETSNEVAVQVNGDVKKYTPSSSQKSTTLTATDPFYWENTGNIDVTAWYFGKTYMPSLPSELSVNTSQSTYDGYKQSDVLYAHGMLSYAGNKSLTFYHQTAKVVVHVLRGDDTPTGMTISGMETRKLSTEVNWVAPTEEANYGRTTASNDPNYLQNFCPFPLGEMDITLPDNKVTAKTLASYKFLIVPQEVTRSEGTLFTITAENYGASFNYTPESDIEWQAGHEYTYYITIKGSKVTATVGTNIGWTEGATGSGSVTLPETYDLSTAQSINISDDKTYLITGSGSNNITISGGTPTVTLESVTLMNAKINITGGSPTLIIQGSNTITNGSISLTNNANVTVKGQNANNNENVLNISNGSIGSSTDRAECGNIVIEGIDATITSSSHVAGIGSAKNGKCGNITIQKSIIDVTGKDGSAAIGSGFYSSECGNIEIINSDITASGSAYSSFLSSAIGCGGNQSSCKDITITLQEEQSKDEFEEKLTASAPAEKVGLGGMIGGALSGGVGTITWKISNGTVIETIGPRVF